LAAIIIRFIDRYSSVGARAMAKDGTRGCSMTMKEMMTGSKTPMMKSGM
jgi:hypothetical protein